VQHNVIIREVNDISLYFITSLTGPGRVRTAICHAHTEGGCYWRNYELPSVRPSVSLWPVPLSTTVWDGRNAQEKKSRFTKGICPTGNVLRPCQLESEATCHDQTQQNDIVLCIQNAPRP